MVGGGGFFLVSIIIIFNSVYTSTFNHCAQLYFQEGMGG